MGYRSAFDGPAPTIQQFTTPAEEAEFVVVQIQEWLDSGVSPSAIGVTARTRRDLARCKECWTTPRFRGPSWAETESPASEPPRCTRAKPRVRARLAVVAVNADNLPYPLATTAASEDEAQHGMDILRERCLLYVALLVP